MVSCVSVCVSFCFWFLCLGFSVSLVIGCGNVIGVSWMWFLLCELCSMVLKWMFFIFVIVVILFGIVCLIFMW